MSFNLHKRVDAKTWRAFARPAKRLHVLDRLELGDDGSLLATVAGKGDTGEVTLEFDLGGAVLDEAIKAHGAMPLPPYIEAKRGTEERDKTDYQTVYAAVDGAVAAPTAGLHFTEALLQELSDHGRRHRAGDAACRGRDVPADEGRRHRRPRDARRMGRADRRRSCERLAAAQGEGRPDRRGRHHQPAAAGDGGAGDRRARSRSSARPTSSSRRASASARSTC